LAQRLLHCFISPCLQKIKDPNGKGYIYLLRPTPELWTLALPHRTQIVYTPDTAFILAKLCVKPGTICLEAGTGSGSFTHAIARQVAPNGKVYTFEFHQKRHELNIVEFTSHGLDGLVVAQHRDVCAEGFSGIAGFADCAFLDLPAPWDAIPHLLNVFTRTRVARVCCFSPCIEQVLATHSALRKFGFTNITTYTLQHRNYEVRSLPMHSVEEACDRLYNIKQRVKQGLPREPRVDFRKRKPDGDGLSSSVVARGDTEINMHTSFLTFGELMPLIDGVGQTEATVSEEEHEIENG
jgi:tRNA (adenine57-N1/adenine58-N1)-methyltransferase catalytic subunit